MLVQTTLDTLNRLKLYGMAAALTEQLTQSAAASLAFEERLGLIVDREVLHRDNRRLTRLLQLAQLKHGHACVEDIDYRTRPGTTTKTGPQSPVVSCAIFSLTQLMLFLRRAMKPTTASPAMSIAYSEGSGTGAMSIE